METHKKIKFRAFALLAAGLMAAQLLTSCLGSEGDSNESNSETTTAFPSSLAVASPFDYTDDTSSTSSLSAVTASSTGSYVTKYAWATAKIDQILNGTTPGLCTFDPALYLTQDADANCFGPLVAYSGHPDGTDSSPLPTGDVGLWTEDDNVSGDACAAAELNARMQGARDKAITSLMGLASLICVMNVNGISMPVNNSEDLTSEMNALGITDVSFTAASIAHSDASGDDEYSYDLDFTYTPGSDTHDIVVEMVHIPGSAPAEYQGRLSYLVNNAFTGGGCPSSDITHNGSLLYDRNSLTDLDLEVRWGEFCEHDSDGRTSGLVDPSDKYDPTSNPDGWANNFSILTANFDPTTMDGDFAYSWQAGEMDMAARVFNISMIQDATGALPEAAAFYGYGDDIEDTDGSITGFFCNWAGPNGVFGDPSRTLDSLVQYQLVSFDTSTGKFGADTTNITYAPTSSCDYDGTGSFTYDSDIDGVVDTDPATPITNDLVSVTDADANGTFDEIEAAGFTLPTSPSNI